MILINLTPYRDHDMLMKICIHQLAGMTSKFHQLSMTGNWARFFSLFRHPSNSGSADTEFEHKVFAEEMNDGDLPCDMIVVNFLRLELDGVKANDDGNLSTAMAKSLDNNELEANANSAAQNRNWAISNWAISNWVEVVGTFLVKTLSVPFPFLKQIIDHQNF
jgi:hypothetical protein